MPSKQIYQFTVELKHYKPRIWRRIQVSGDTQMSSFAYIMMALFEMQGYHLFCFNVPVAEEKVSTISKENKFKKALLKADEMPYKIKELTLKVPAPEDIEAFNYGLNYDARMIYIQDIFPKISERAVFCYDFGDDWQFLIKLEKIIDIADLANKEMPRVLKGKGYGIVEDCGGVYGLDNELFDLTEFDLEDMDDSVKGATEFFKEIYEEHLENP